jgi:hypothetical protein
MVAAQFGGEKETGGGRESGRLENLHAPPDQYD